MISWYKAWMQACQKNLFYFSSKNKNGLHHQSLDDFVYCEYDAFDGEINFMLRNRTPFFHGQM